MKRLFTACNNCRRAGACPLMLRDCCGRGVAAFVVGLGSQSALGVDDDQTHNCVGVVDGFAYIARFVSVKFSLLGSCIQDIYLAAEFLPVRNWCAVYLQVGSRFVPHG